MTTRSRALIVGFALLGLGAASYSSYVHYQLLTVPGYASVCDIGATLNCSQAYLSKYGSFMGVPVALGGVFFFAAVLVLAGVAGNRSSARETAPAYIFAFSTIGLAFVLYLAWASYFVLKTLCIMCAITYVSVIAIFIVSGGAVTFPMTKLPRRALRDARTLVTSPLSLLIIALFAGSAAAAVTLFPEGAPLSIAASEEATPQLTDEQRREVERWIAAQPRVDIPIPNDGAKVLVLKFSDFQCPACKTTHDAYRGILAKYAPTEVKFMLKHYPLEGECNSAVQQGNHFASCEAAAATVMARASNQADRMTDWLFANQERLSPAVVKQGAKDVAGIADFDARYSRALQEVRTDASLGTMLKVGSTPTFFVNGIRVVGGVPPQYFEGIIELELKKAK